ncbi:MAG TPA: TetR/AcrR family transcriptional regulator [Bacillota bacterium]|nr:TetR/AcrR family transcriptional regulator [Bacillota bacterium]HQL35099.1 TetR/AcrR family transcriptional regulator [Bacillota bacterium]
MNRRTEKKLKDLLEKSKELFLKYGYNAVAVDRIADEAGISKMTIYKYYNSKEDLFMEVIKKDIEHYACEIMKAISESSSSIERIETLYNYSTDMAKNYSLVLIRDIMEKKNLLDKVTEIKKNLMLPIFEHIIYEGIRNKEIRELDLDFMSELLMNLPKALLSIDFLSDENKMIKFYGNFIDFLKFGLFGEKERVKSAEEDIDEGRKPEQGL